MTAVLLVDDDVELAEMLGDYLAQDGFVVTTLHDGESGVEAALSGKFSIAVLDVMMPRMSGVDALRQIRALSSMPVRSSSVPSWLRTSSIQRSRSARFDFSQPAMRLYSSGSL